MNDVREIEGGYKRDLGNGKSLFLYQQLFGNSKLAVGDTDNDWEFDDFY